MSGVQGPSREMTLDEWVDRLPLEHRARKDLATLRAEVGRLRGALRPFAGLTPPESAPDDALVVLAALNGGIIDTRQTVSVAAIRGAKAALTPPSPGEQYVVVKVDQIVKWRRWAASDRINDNLVSWLDAILAGGGK